MKNNSIVRIIAYFFLIAVSVNAIADDKTIEEKVAKVIEMQGPIPEIKPELGFVPTQEVAIKIAEAILTPIFKEELRLEQPFRAVKKNDLWIINGRERKKCKDSDKNCFQLDGSPVHMEISAKDGRVIKLYKYK